MRYGTPSLLQVEASMPRRILKILVENFEVEDDIVVRSADRLDFSDWMPLHRLPLPQLKDAPFAPRRTLDAATHENCVFDDIREQDILVHHPVRLVLVGRDVSAGGRRPIRASSPSR